MGLFKKYVNQTRKPEGPLGKLMLGGMNSGHTKLADWGMTRLPEKAPARIVELGCGGGRNAGELLRRYPDAELTAIDHSPLSVEKAAAYNDRLIREGRCVVRQGDVSALDLPDSAFDLAAAFETVYFWPGLTACFSEVCRVLREGGAFLIVNESDGLDASGKKFEKIIDGMKCYTAEELKAALEAAGFTAVTTVHHPSKPWLCVVAVK